MRGTAVFVLGVLLSAAAAASAAGQTQARLIVAYIHADGELVPVARFDGTTWRNTWPEPILRDVPLPVRTLAEIPRSWLGGPVPLTWTAWSAATGQHRRVRVTDLEREGACVEAITLATSHTGARADGLAFSRPTTATAIIEPEESSPERDRWRREIAPRFRVAINKLVPPKPGGEHDDLGSQVLALARADKFAAENVVVDTVFRDPRLPVFFIEASRQFSEIQADTYYDSVSYGGWFRNEGARAGTLIPISASVTPFSSGEGRLPSYTPVGILRVGAGAIWVMSEWGKESQTIVLFDVSAKGVRKLTSADISGC